MKEIIGHLAYLLEFQEIYFREIFSNVPALIRSHAENLLHDKDDNLLSNTIPAIELDDLLKIIGISLKDELEECYLEDSTVNKYYLIKEDYLI
jgi:hypothetical protein